MKPVINIVQNYFETPHGVSVFCHARECGSRPREVQILCSGLAKSSSGA